MKGCSCQRCRKGMHTKFGGKMVQRFIRKVRRAAKRALKKGEEPPPCRSLEYTD